MVYITVTLLRHGFGHGFIKQNYENNKFNHLNFVKQFFNHVIVLIKAVMMIFQPIKLNWLKFLIKFF